MLFFKSEYLPHSALYNPHCKCHSCCMIRFERARNYKRDVRRASYADYMLSYYPDKPKPK